MSDVQRVINRNRDNALRIAARSQPSDQQIQDIRADNSASRIAARSQLSEQQVEDIRADDSASRIVARSNLPNHNLNELFWGSLNDIRQRVQVPDNISYYRDAQQVSGHAIFLSHEFTGIVQLEMSGDFLQTEEAFQATLTHMETVKVYI